MGLVVMFQKLRNKLQQANDAVINEMQIKQDIHNASKWLDSQLPIYELVNTMTQKRIFAGNLLDCVGEIDRLWPNTDLSALVQQGIQIRPLDAA